MIEVAGPDGMTGWMDADSVLIINPFVDKGAIVFGTCVVVLKGGIPPMIAKESPGALAEKVNAARRGAPALVTA